MTGIYTEKYADGFATTLTAAITSTTRPVTFAVAANSPQLPSGNFRVAIFNVVSGNPVNVERLKVTAISGLSWTATTEASSSAVTHPNGSTVQSILTAEQMIQDMTDHTTPATVADPHTQYIRKSNFTTKGDLLVATGSGTFTRLAVGANGKVLVADSTTASGLAFQTIAGATFAHEEFAPAAAATTVTLAAIPSVVLIVSRNGVVQSAVDSDYSIAGSVITFSTAFGTGERVVVSYAY